MRQQPVLFFELAAVRGLLLQEWNLVREGATRIASGSALSLGPVPSGAEAGFRSHPAMIHLHLDERSVCGDLRCQPEALPIESDSIQLLVARHVLDLLDLDSGITEELARVLAPGGTLYLFGMNKLSPWRLWSALNAQETGSRPRLPSLVRVQRKFARASLNPVRKEFLGGAWPGTVGDAGFKRGGRLNGAWVQVLTKQRSAVRAIPLRQRDKAISLGHGLAQMPSRRACL